MTRFQQLLKVLSIPVHDAAGLKQLFGIARELFQAEGILVTDAWGKVLLAEGTLSSDSKPIPLLDGASLSLNPCAPTSPVLDEFVARVALLVDYLTLKASLEEERQQRLIANTLNDIGLILTSQLDPKTIFSQILEQMARVMPYDAASVWLLHGNESRLLANRHQPEYQPATHSFFVETDTILQEILREKRVLILSDVQADQRWPLGATYSWIRSWATTPILINGQVIGQFTLDHHEKNFYNDSHAPILESLSRQMSIAAQNAQLFEALQESLQLKSRFISTVSHEFRTPLASILANSQIIERYDQRLSSTEKMTYHARIKVQIEYLSRLLDDVLLVSRADSLGFRLSIDSDNLKAFCDEIIAEIRLLAPENLDIQLEMPANCYEIAFDSKLMRHILFNLLSNAVKYSPAGGVVRLTISCEKQELNVTVQDEGIGIPAEDQPRLFQNFFRASNAADIKGTGLGLTIVKRAVEAYGGAIALSSEEGKGTSIEIRLPRFDLK